MIQEFLVLLVSYLGLLLGFFLAKIAPEEKEPGKKYILLFRKLLLAVIFLIIFVYNFINIYWTIILLLILGSVAVILILRQNSILDYAVLGLLIFSTHGQLITLAGLILIYGMLIGILRSEKGWKKLMLIHLHYIVIGLFTTFLF
jgi:hypothetical protein